MCANIPLCILRNIFCHTFWAGIYTLLMLCKHTPLCIHSFSTYSARLFVSTYIPIMLFILILHIAIYIHRSLFRYSSAHFLVHSQLWNTANSVVTYSARPFPPIYSAVYSVPPYCTDHCLPTCSVDHLVTSVCAKIFPRIHSLPGHDCWASCAWLLFGNVLSVFSVWRKASRLFFQNIFSSGCYIWMLWKASIRNHWVITPGLYKRKLAHYDDKNLICGLFGRLRAFLKHMISSSLQ